MAQATPTTDEAFKLLLESDFYWSRTGESHAMKRTYKKRMYAGTGLSIEKKEALLAKAGFGVHQEKTWDLPK